MPSADALPEPATPIATPAATTRSPRTALSAFQLRGGAFTLLVLRLSDPKDPSMFQFLADKVAQAPNFFRHAPLVLDLQDLADAPPFNIAELGRRLRQHQLVPVGVQNGTDDQHKAAVNAGLCLFPAGRKTAPLTVAEGGGNESPAAGNSAAAADATVAAAPPAMPASPVVVAPKEMPPAQPPAVAPTPPARPVAMPMPPAVAPVIAPVVAPIATVEATSGGKTTLLVTQPVRSGQRVYAQGGDLVVVTSISPGAELLADGHIHVYGTLRGRAFAGIEGDESALIFCDQLEAELLSIAGVHVVSEAIDPKHQRRRARVALEGDRLVIHALS